MELSSRDETGKTLVLAFRFLAKGLVSRFLQLCSHFDNAEQIAIEIRHSRRKRTLLSMQPHPSLPTSGIAQLGACSVVSVRARPIPQYAGLPLGQLLERRQSHCCRRIGCIMLERKLEDRLGKAHQIRRLAPPNLLSRPSDHLRSSYQSDQVGDYVSSHSRGTHEFYGFNARSNSVTVGCRG